MIKEKNAHEAELQAIRRRHEQDLENLKSALVQDIERYKVQLKKSEFIFQKEYEATSELVALFRSFLPHYHHPDMEWSDVLENIAESFEQIEVKFNSFVARHGAVLGEEISDILSSAIALAGSNKFETTVGNVSADVRKAAEDWYEKVRDAERRLIERVLSQASC